MSFFGWLIRELQNNKNMGDSITIKEGMNTLTRAGRLCVWLVDDHDDFRQPLAQLLNLEPGVECARDFSSAAAALLALQEESPDAILLDVEMPKLNGLEAIKPIKKLSPETAVLMLTTFLDEAARKQSLENGAADYLLKHFSTDEIVAALRAATSPNASESRLS